MNSPLVTIWNGLKKLEGQHWDKRERLLAQLKAKRAISEADQNWLDGAVDKYMSALSGSNGLKDYGP